MQVRDVLRTKGGGVISIGPDLTVDDAVSRMVKNNIGSLPVLDTNGDLVGIFSERDVLREMAAHGESFRKTRIADVMTKSPVTCDADDDIDCVLKQMSERRIAKVPVVSGGRLVGIISVGDMIKQLYERARSENDHLMSYIHGTI